ncbi:hypothetical protein CVCC1112_1560 [Paenarthrobacter nicotinovorans]|nr:hypothetical protein CVCC1112_1560 [Paenarthrobacter nicotinovorans]
MWADWQAANEAADAGSAGKYASELLKVTPDSFFSWFEAGLLSKARANWAESVERNQRALDLFTERDAIEFGGASPAAWNLGIAATALGDWATARRAWAAYGLAGFDGEDGPLEWTVAWPLSGSILTGLVFPTSCCPIWERPRSFGAGGEALPTP